jgi:hypothetical protein
VCFYVVIGKLNQFVMPMTMTMTIASGRDAMESPESDCLSRLEEQLRADSRAEAPPWASDAVANAAKCGDEAARRLMGHVAEADAESFLALEALRIHFPGDWAAIAPAQRAAIYARHLETEHWFNVWGQPGEPSTDTAQALIGLGPAAIPYLAPLLDSKRPAMSSGSEDATISRLAQYRVCDYAWAFIAQLQGRPVTSSTNPEDRDREIEKMKRRLREER